MLLFYLTFMCVYVAANSDDSVSLRGPVMGRITGSASIETLVRVGIEKENGVSPDSKMVVLHDFSPCVDDELEVKRGTVVNVLYQENDWVYVITESSQQEGFIPHSYCAPFGSHLADLAMSVKKKLPRDIAALPTENNGSVTGGGSVPPAGTTSVNGAVTGGGVGVGGTQCYHNPAVTDDRGGAHGLNKDAESPTGRNRPRNSATVGSCAENVEIHPFFKDPSGRYIVLYTFISRDENDLSVERGEFVTVLNKEDPDWYWIERSDGQEGFVPSAFVYPADVLPGESFWSRTTTDTTGKKSRHNNSSTTGTDPALTASVGAPGHQSTCLTGSYHGNSQQSSTCTPAVQSGNEPVSYFGTEMVMLYDYKAQAPDDLTVRRGDWIYADLTSQTVEGWLWVYSPKTRKHGFIPKAYARPPAMTSL